MIRSTSGLRGVPAADGAGVKVTLMTISNMLPLRQRLGSLLSSTQDASTPYNGKKTHGTASTMQRCKRSSKWIGEAMCLTVVLLPNSNPYLSAGGATAVGYSMPVWLQS